MNTEIVLAAAKHFAGTQDLQVEELGSGLIHHTFKVSDPENLKSIVLQAINTSVFPRPEVLVRNYLVLFEWLDRKETPVSIPAPVLTLDGNLIWIDEGARSWRATKFIDHAYSPLEARFPDNAYAAASAFASFTRSLAGMDTRRLQVVIPNFHHLTFRYSQLEEAIQTASLERRMKATFVIAELRQRKSIIRFFESILHNPAYPDRVMHHDCKVSNILFDSRTNNILCPIDLDTVMPGKYFSDLGDMIRSMSCTVEENSVQWESIDIRPQFYNAIVQGYLDGIKGIFSQEEQSHIHYAGLIMIFMQTCRFLTDFLNDDAYYHTSYPEQNLNRALNQLILLQKLEDFLFLAHSFDYSAKQ